MLIARNFFRQKPIAFDFHRSVSRPVYDAQGRIRVPIYADWFSKLNETELCTNSMYAEIKSEIESSIETYNTREKIVLNVYENTESSEFNRDRVLIGFRKYLAVCYDNSFRITVTHFIVFAAFFLFGLICMLYTYVYPHAEISDFASNFSNTISGVFMWQFLGYLAFELPGELRVLRRLAQMIGIEYEFTIWE